MKALVLAKHLLARCVLSLALTGLACTPKVAIEAPKEPIVINMNVKIEHEIKVKVDEGLDDVFEDEELFGEGE